jgi:hypothetical protein
MIRKTFDEMTGNGQVTTDHYVVFETKGFLVTKTSITIGFALVVGEGFRQGWLIAISHTLDWQFIGNTQVLALVDGERASFDGVVRSSDSNFIGDTLYCDEEFHAAVDEEFLEAISKSSNAKLRLAGIDVVVPPALAADVAELLKAI